MALAKTAPVAPATARPQGGIDISFDNPAIILDFNGECCEAFSNVASLRQVLVVSRSSGNRGTRTVETIHTEGLRIKDGVSCACQRKNN